MPIGSTLTNSVPAVGSSGTAYATSVNALLNEMKTAIEGTVPFSALSGSTLDMDNVPIIDASYVAFYNTTGTPSAAIAGRFVYSDGELWAVNSTGAIQITSGSGLNASAIGGIGGDYGSPNPASVQFVDAAWRYDFYDNYTALEYGYVRSAGVDIASGGHVATSNFAKLRYAGSTNLTFTLPPTLPASNRSVLTIDSTGAIKFNDGTSTVTNDLVMAGTTRVREIGRKKTFSFSLLNSSTSAVGGVTYANDLVDTIHVDGIKVTANGNLGIITMMLEGLDIGTTITSVTIRTFKAGVGNTQCNFKESTDGTVTTLSTSAVDNTSGWRSITMSGTWSVTAGKQYYVRITTGNTNDIVTYVEVTYNS